MTWEDEGRLTYTHTSHTQSIAVHGNNIYVVYEDIRDQNHPDPNWELYYNWSPDFGQSWDFELRLTNAIYQSASPGLAVWHDGSQLALVWEDHRHAPDPYESLYFKSGTQFAKPTPVVSIEIIPDNPPIYVPQGRSFTYTGALINNTDQTQIVDVEINLDVPRMGLYGPIESYNDIHLEPYDTITFNGIRQRIPNFAPLGYYEYIVGCGDLPSRQYDEDEFGFTVINGNGDNDSWVVGQWTEAINIPSEPALLTAYPNPFNASTTIRYRLAADTDVLLSIYNLLGEKVSELVDEKQKAGEYEITWDASLAAYARSGQATLASGIYFARLTMGSETFTEKMVLLK